ncbi:MAG: rRNA (cytosine1402-N4)-methyltransferase [Rikenellaceae bacterium]|jgi:16S rRNA (cytosine1402-N4)-methyltransferase|nr:rRNA (cytosine1402-N4)-methyltransferase [Rikenellaceae bacterium]
MSNQIYHIPVLLNEVIKEIPILNQGIYVDGTFGSGGHSRAILSIISKKSKLFAFDIDADALANEINDSRFTLINANFKFIRYYLNYFDALPADFILADLGLSSHHLETDDRGFSFMSDVTLDMRMHQEQEITAKEILNNYSEEDLINIFKNYGNVSFAVSLVRDIIDKRKIKTIETSSELNELALKYIPKGKEFKNLAKIYQALRIAVNNEVENLKMFIEESYQALSPGGKLCVITFNSLEDQILKSELRKKINNLLDENWLKGNKNERWSKIYKISPTPEEIIANNRSRSAKMYVAIKNNNKV